ncbi:DUF4375 domain-containing protein [Propionibacterium freudenreichii]|uniref:DMP19 family protein n=1 Tax=Propionibacterium freudenreichii TaxID=1744 RepID=UPI00254BDE0D|nr:DUF4375 domain-containing protein [Propionibacterium freudenreichii]MDK9322669.1 DUF4375 domain-containing protein [Propionibacterium freudenreichii]MDK9325032.1 DUF4375 domain-containing protein [Propionibacterium freudenreichii]
MSVRDKFPADVLTTRDRGFQALQSAYDLWVGARYSREGFEALAPRDQEKAALYTLLTRTMNASFTSFLEDDVAIFMGTAAQQALKNIGATDTLAIIEEYRQHLTPFADAQAWPPYSQVPEADNDNELVARLHKEFFDYPDDIETLAADYYGNDPEPTDAPKLPSSGEELAMDIDEITYIIEARFIGVFDPPTGDYGTYESWPAIRLLPRQRRQIIEGWRYQIPYGAHATGDDLAEASTFLYQNNVDLQAAAQEQLKAATN